MPVKAILNTSYPVHITSVMIVHASLMTIIIVHNIKKKLYIRKSDSSVLTV